MAIRMQVNEILMKFYELIEVVGALNTNKMTNFICIERKTRPAIVIDY